MTGNEVFFLEVEDELEIIRNFIQNRFITYIQENKMSIDECKFNSL
jgi:hypothetical protein